MAAKTTGKIARRAVVLLAGLALAGCTQAVGGTGGTGTSGGAAPGAAGEPVAELPVLGQA